MDCETPYHDSDRLVCIKSGVSLTDLVIYASLFDHAYENLPAESVTESLIESHGTHMICLPRNLNPLRSNFAENADRYARAGKGLD
jgi:hypothetical protein